MGMIDQETAGLLSQSSYEFMVGGTHQESPGLPLIAWVHGGWDKPEIN